MTDDTRNRVRKILLLSADLCSIGETDDALSEIEKLVDGEVDNGIRLGAVSAISMKKDKALEQENADVLSARWAKPKKRGNYKCLTANTISFVLSSYSPSRIFNERN